MIYFAQMIQFNSLNTKFYFPLRALLKSKILGVIYNVSPIEIHNF